MALVLGAIADKVAESYGFGVVVVGAEPIARGIVEARSFASRFDGVELPRGVRGHVGGGGRKGGAGGIADDRFPWWM